MKIRTVSITGSHGFIERHAAQLYEDRVGRAVLSSNFYLAKRDFIIVLQKMRSRRA